MSFAERIIESVQPCSGMYGQCQSTRLLYPSSSTERHGRVKVICYDCGKFFGYYDHQRLGDPHEAAEKKRQREQLKGYD